MMEYKGYVAEVSFDDEARVLHGEVINTRDVITFQADAVPALEQEFHKSVDVHLQFCTEIGQEPERPFSGKFVIRLSPETHRRAYLAAKRAGKSLNTWVSDVLREKLPDRTAPKASRASARRRRRKSKAR